jgi:hypothetical protein
MSLSVDPFRLQFLGITVTVDPQTENLILWQLSKSPTVTFPILQAYIHIIEIQERENFQLLRREFDAAAAALNPPPLTVAPESLEMERPQGPRLGDVEMREAAAEGGLAGAGSPSGAPVEVRTKAQRMGDQLKKDAKWVRKRATHEFGRWAVFVALSDAPNPET